MIVNLHVKEITLHGIPVRHFDLPLVEQAIRSHLEAHFRELAEPETAFALPAERGRINVSQTVDPVGFGQDLARAIYPFAHERPGEVS